MSDLHLHGYHLSVYAWIARLTLAEKGLTAIWHEVDPFADDCPPAYRDLHPFQRVPVLVHGVETIYETAAIARYVDEGFEGPALQPADPLSRARMTQITSVADSYAYWPLVRQVFAHDVLGRRVERTVDEAEIEAGLAAAPRVLAALESLAGDGLWLLGDMPTLADCHLAPMMAYFAMSERGQRCLDAVPRLGRWLARIQARPTFAATMPAIPSG